MVRKVQEDCFEEQVIFNKLYKIIGKNYSTVTEYEPIISGVVNFNTQIRLKVDDSAIDTQRVCFDLFVECSLTLNFLSSSEKTTKMVGLVVINLPKIGEEISKCYKITSTPDKDAEIDISRITLRELPTNDNNESQRQHQNQHQRKGSLKFSRKSKSILSSSESSQLTSNKKLEDRPTSPPSILHVVGQIKENNKNNDHFKITNMENTIKQLEREKELLKKLLKIETLKSKTAYEYLEEIISLVCGETLLGELSHFKNVDYRDNHEELTPNDGDNNSKNDFESIKKYKNTFYGNGNNPEAGAGSGSGNNNYNNQKNVIRSINEKIPKTFTTTTTSLSKISLNNILIDIQKNFEDSEKSKAEINKMFEKEKEKSQKIEFDQFKLKRIKVNIDKSYVNLLNKTKWQKEDIFRHKLEIGILIDELLKLSN